MKKTTLAAAAALTLLTGCSGSDTPGDTTSTTTASPGATAPVTSPATTGMPTPGDSTPGASTTTTIAPLLPQKNIFGYIKATADDPLGVFPTDKDVVTALAAMTENTDLRGFVLKSAAAPEDTSVARQAAAVGGGTWMVTYRVTAEKTSGIGKKTDPAVCQAQLLVAIVPPQADITPVVEAASDVFPKGVTPQQLPGTPVGSQTAAWVLNGFALPDGSVLPQQSVSVASAGSVVTRGMVLCASIDGTRLAAGLAQTALTGLAGVSADGSAG